MDFRILDTDYRDVDVLEVFKSIIWTDRYWAHGDFELVLYPTIENLSYLMEDYYLWSKDSTHLMIIEDIQIKTDVEAGNELIVTGRSLESLLDRRIVWQQTILSGNFQEGIKKLIDDSIITPSDSSRIIPNFIFEYSTDPAITELTIEHQITGRGLYEVISTLCSERNIGFKVVLSSDNKFVFSMYAGEDRSYNQFKNPYVIFSPDFDNLINSNYFSSKRGLKTIALVAGEGEGLARTTIEVLKENGGGIGLNRRELYVDARDISSNNGQVSQNDYLELLRQRGINYLAENITIKAFEGNAANFHMYVFNKDFYMGDVVQIANEYNIESTSRVVEIVRSQNEEGVNFYPTFLTIPEIYPDST